jgi:hypothetical protein
MRRNTDSPRACGKLDDQAYLDLLGEVEVRALSGKLVAAVLASDLLTDETSWPEARQTLWLWIFVAIIATWHYVAGRGKERVENVLDGCTGWLMSDGWGPYRHDPRRLHCWHT